MYEKAKTIAVYMFAIAIVIAAVSFAVSRVLDSISVHHESSHKISAAYQANAEDDRKVASEKIAQKCNDMNFIRFRNCIYGEIESYYRDQATNEDLQAQQDKADWAYFLLIATIFSVSLSVIGLAVLVISLRQTGKALKDGRKTADAAREANKIMRDEQRPWIDFSLPKFGRFQQQQGTNIVSFSDFPISVENFGGSPALNVWAVGGCIKTNKGLDIAAEIKRVVSEHKSNWPDHKIGKTIFPNAEPIKMQIGLGHRQIVDITETPEPNVSESNFLILALVYRRSNDERLFYSARAYNYSLGRKLKHGWRCKLWEHQFNSVHV